MNSVVWLADDPQRAGTFAVKEISKPQLPVPVERLFSEARTMFRAGHKNVVRVDCAFQTTDLVCLGMRYYPDGSLLKRINPSPLSAKEAVYIGQGILAGLAHIHTQGIIHYDLKPSNVLMDGREPLIADFGQSRMVDANGIAALPPIYAEAYPPECLSAASGSVHADIYQVGLLLYRAVNGEEFYGEQRGTGGLRDKIIRGKFPDRSKFLPHVPRRMKTVIRKALSVKPEDRYDSAPDFSDDLGRVNPSLNWQTEVFSDGRIEWRADRSGQAPLLVRLLPSGSDWATEVYTAGAQVRRMNPNDSTHWATGVTREQAINSLKTLFESWE